MSAVKIWFYAILSSLHMCVGMVKTCEVSSVLNETNKISVTNVVVASVSYLISGYCLMVCTGCSASTYESIMVGLMWIAWYIGDKHSNKKDKGC